MGPGLVTMRGDMNPMDYVRMVEAIEDTPPDENGLVWDATHTAAWRKEPLLAALRQAHSARK